MGRSSDADQTVTERVLEKSILAKFPRELRQSLTQEAVRLMIPAGTVLYYEQDEPRCGLVLSGLIRVYMSSPDTREITVRYARVGELLGIATIVGGPAPVNVQILTDATLLMFSTQKLQACGQTVPNIGWLLAQEVTQRLYDSLEALAVNVFGSLRQRIVLHLLDLAASRQKGGNLVARITQQELADAVGSVRPVIARILRELRHEGLISTSSAGIVLCKPDELYRETWVREV